MTRFYIVTPDGEFRKVNLHHDACLDIASHAPTEILTKDIEYWRDHAQHTSTFRVSSRLAIICLDAEKLLKKQ